MDKSLQEDDIKAALISQSGSIYNRYDVSQFLQQHDYYKHIGARFLCWMIQLNLLSPIRAKWVPELYNMYVSYSNLRINYFPDPNFNPLQKLPSKSQESVESDIAISEAWFCRLIEQTGIQSHYKDDAKMRFLRIIATINLEFPQLSYIKGNDRFVWISYLVSLSFSSNGGLDKTFAESMAFYLSRALISNVKVSRYIDDFQRLERHFSKLDWRLEQEEPDVSEVLSQDEHFAIHYALKWELTLFSDEHKANELMFIWDQIISRLDKYNEFVRCLCIAHIKQVPLTKVPGEMIINIQQNRSWDVSKIVDDATDMMETDEVTCLTKVWNLITSMCSEHCVF